MCLGYEVVQNNSLATTNLQEMLWLTLFIRWANYY
jgi:hypothetical protein